MMCRVCGRAVSGGMQFCPQCGTRVAVEPPAFVAERVRAGYRPGRGRVAEHRQLVGVLWCIDGAIQLLGLGILCVFFQGPILHDPGAPVSWFSVGLVFVLGLVGVTTVLALASGYGLLTRRRWGRGVALAAAVLSVVRVPFGTVLGVYTLWVLGPGVAGEEWVKS